MTLRQKISLFVVLVISVGGYLLLAYTIPRESFRETFLVYTFLFAGFLYLNTLANKIPLKYLLASGVIFRLLFIVSLPALSNDYFRFIWDGRLIANGISPYSFSPLEITNQGIIVFNDNWKSLMDGMGGLSAGNHTSYPPLNQFFFYLAAQISGGNILNAVIFLRLIIVTADILIMWWGIKLLSYFQLPKRRILLFALNPFVIIEFSGNLHFESIMLLFLLLGISMFYSKKFIAAGVFLAVSIGIKLMPLMLIPLFLRSMNIKQALRFYGAITIVGVLILLPVVNSVESAHNFLGSINLWFKSFEFNASLYNVARFISYQVKGYNIFYKYSWVFPVLLIFIVLFVTFLKKHKTKTDLIFGIVVVYTMYLLISRTVHPWYILIPMFFSIYTSYRFVIVWSFLIFVSYSAYGNPLFEENYFLIFIEYFSVTGFLIFEHYVPGKSLRKVFLA